MSQKLLSAIGKHINLDTENNMESAKNKIQINDANNKKVYESVQIRCQQPVSPVTENAGTEGTKTPLSTISTPFNKSVANSPKGNGKCTCKVCHKRFPSKELCLAHDIREHALSHRTIKDIKCNIVDWKSDTTLRNRLNKDLEDCTINEELEYIYRIYRFDPEMIESVWKSFVNDLQKLLPWDINVHQFGSMKSTLALKDADLDVFLEDTTGTYDHFKLFDKLRKDMRKSRCFTWIINIPKARVPIIKCIHKQSNMKVDINMTALCSLETTRLITDIGHADVRLMRFFFFIKVWAKQQALISPKLFNSYTVIMMVINYLQSISLLPSIKEMQAVCPAKYLRGVNYAYDKTMLEKLPEDVTDRSLIKGFFKHSSSLSLSSTIISPYLGRTLAISDFSKSTFPEYEAQRVEIFKATGEMPPDFKCQNSAVIVQDAFKLYINTAHMISFKRLRTIQSIFKWANDVSERLITSDSTTFYDTLLFGSVPIDESRIIRTEGQTNGEPEKKSQRRKKKKKQPVENTQQQIVDNGKSEEPAIKQPKINQCTTVNTDEPLNRDSSNGNRQQCLAINTSQKNQEKPETHKTKIKPAAAMCASSVMPNGNHQTQRGQLQRAIDSGNSHISTQNSNNLFPQQPQVSKKYLMNQILPVAPISYQHPQQTTQTDENKRAYSRGNRGNKSCRKSGQTKQI